MHTYNKYIQRLPLGFIAEGLLLWFNKIRGGRMIEYINRLIACGYAPHNAYAVCRSFARDFSIVELNMFVQSIEHDEREDGHVGRV